MVLLMILKIICLCVTNIRVEKFRDCFSLMPLRCHLVKGEWPFLLCVSLGSKTVQMHTDVEFHISRGEDVL